MFVEATENSMQTNIEKTAGRKERSEVPHEHISGANGRNYRERTWFHSGSRLLSMTFVFCFTPAGKNEEKRERGREEIGTGDGEVKVERDLALANMANLDRPARPWGHSCLSAPRSAGWRRI